MSFINEFFVSNITNHLQNHVTVDLIGLTEQCRVGVITRFEYIHKCGKTLPVLSEIRISLFVKKLFLDFNKLSLLW